MYFRVAGASDCRPCQKWAKPEGFVEFPKTMARVGHLKRICKDAFSVAGAVQETSSSQLLGGPGGDFLKGVAFWSWDDFAWQVQHFVWPGVTFSWQAQYFRQVEWKNRKTHWYEAVSAALNFRFLKEVSQNCFVFDVVSFRKWGSLAELLCFWRCWVQTLRKSHRIAALLMLSTLRNEEVSQNCFLFDVVKFKHWGSLAELLRFWCCQVQNVRTPRRIISFVFNLADRQVDTQTERRTDRQTDRPTGRPAGRQTDRQPGRQTDRQRDRKTERER